MACVDMRVNLGRFTTVDGYIRYINRYIGGLGYGDQLNVFLDVQTFITIEYFVITVGFIKYLRNKEIEVNIDYNVSTYAQRIDFYQQLDINIEENFTRHNATGRFCEIREINEFNDVAIVGEMISIVEANCDLTQELIGCLNYCWYEIVGNVIEHSESPINGFVCAQYYPRDNTIKVVILDCGIGIKNGLRKSEKYSEIEEEDALFECIKEGVTNGKGMGRGLFHTVEFIKNNTGELNIYSGTHKLVVDGNKIRVEEVNNWQGTMVILQIRTNVSVELQEIFKDDIPTSVLEWNECINGLW